MLYNRKVDRLLLFIVPAVLFVYASTRPHIRLRADMPAEFVDVRAPADAKQRAAEERVAQEYWYCALTIIQWKYTYGSPLPTTPPEEFRVNAEVISGSEPLTSPRLRYWRQLRQVWLIPSAWKTSREWNTQWLTEPIKKGLAWINKYLKDLIGRR